MGLFGGFKAKFTRNSTTKTKPQEVVCLKYHVHSEFDGQDLPPPVPNEIKKNEVIRRQSKTKSRKALTKSAIFPESDTSVTSLSSPALAQKSLSMTNLNGDIARQMPGSSGSATTAGIAKKTEEHNGNVVETVAVVTKKDSYSTKNHIKTEKKEKTILKTFSSHDDKKEENGIKNLDNDKSTLIFMTQHSETTDKPIANGDDDDDFGAIFSAASRSHAQKDNFYPKKSTFNEEKEDFKATRSYMQDDNFNISFVPNKTTFDDSEDDSNHTRRSYAQDDNFNISFVPNKTTFGDAQDDFKVSKSYTQENNFNKPFVPNKTTFDDADDFQVARRSYTQEDNFNISFVPNKTTSREEEDDYKVNVVQHDYNRSYSYSEDEKSYQESTDSLEFTKMGFSSQAASIFFGQDVEPEMPRPRRILLKAEEEDDRRSSGADC